MVPKPTPAWREWLKRTRWPVVRQLVQVARLWGRLKRLGQIEALTGQLHTLVQHLDHRAAHLESLFHSRASQLESQIQTVARQLESQIQTVAGQLESQIHSRAGQLESQIHSRAGQLDTQVHSLAAKHDHLYSQVDLVKSAGEVPPEWFEEFRCWKRSNPLPETPLVSVCVATWNRSQLLTERCLASLLRQTYQRLEIVVVGDGCTDDTAECIAALADRRIRFVNLPERGRYPDETMRRWMVAGTVPMNHALSLCSGDFITHLDDDDEHEPTRVEKLVAFARDNDLDFIWHPFWTETKPGEWAMLPGEAFRLGQVTTSSIFYRSWLARIGWDLNAHLLSEPGDWNRLRKFHYLGVKAARFPEPLLRKYVERWKLQAA